VNFLGWVEENQGWPLEIKGRVWISKFSKGNQVRGAGLRFLCCFIKLHEWYDDV